MAQPPSLSQKTLEKSSGISKKLRCAMVGDDRSALTMLSKIFPELSILESDAKELASPLGECREFIYGAPFGVNAWIVAVACESQREIIEKIRSGDCAFGILTEDAFTSPHIERMSLNWQMQDPWIVMLDTQKFANPELYKRLDATAQTRQAIKPMWHALVKSGVLKEEPGRPAGGPSRLTVSSEDPSP